METIMEIIVVIVIMIIMLIFAIGSCILVAEKHK